MTAQNLFCSPLRRAGWLTTERVRGYCILLAIANLVFLLLAICRAHGFGLPRQAHLSTEFAGFYAAGRLAKAGHAAAVYAPGMNPQSYIHSLRVPLAPLLMQQNLSGDPRIMSFPFFYPPVFLPVVTALAWLGFYLAFLLWVGLTGLALVLFLHRALGGWWWGFAAIAYAGVIENAAAGENAFLLAALIGTGFLLRDKNPFRAGLVLGVLCIKPHFLLPVFLLLLAERNWRALAITLLTATLLCLLTLPLYGIGIWNTYFTSTVPHAAFMLRHAGFSYGMQTTAFSALRLRGAGLGLADAAQYAGMAIATICMVASRRADPDIRAAMTCAGFPLLLSVMQDYDYTVCGLACVFLLLAWSRTRILPWEKSVCAAMFVLPLCTWVFRTEFGIPLDPLIPLAFMLVLCFGRLFEARVGAKT